MKLSFRVRPSAFVIPGILALLAVCAVGLSFTPRNAHAATQECRVLLMMDRSASIGDNWTVMRDQVNGLFLNLQDPKVFLGYWTFSNVQNVQPGTNYNAPYHQYVSVMGDPSGYASFMNTLPVDKNDILGGATNYEQAFGFDNFLPNNSSLNAGGVGSVQDLRDDADVLILLTDGLPNYPVDSSGLPLDGNPTAVNRGHTARENYEGKTVIGAYVKNASDPVLDLSSLNATINGSPTDQTNIGPLNFSSIEDYLTDAIADKCDIQQAAEYSLNPTVNAHEAKAEVGEDIHFDYSVDNENDDGSSYASAWQLYDVTINPTVSGNPLNFTSDQSGCTPKDMNKSYCNSIGGCSQIYSLMGGSDKGTCDPVPSGGRGNCSGTPSTDPGTGSTTFTAGSNNVFYKAPNNSPRCVTVGDYPLGTRVCSVLALAKPTNRGTTINRISSAACVTIGKSPLVQVHGGDVRVGRHFAGDTTSGANSGVYTSRFKVSGDPAIVPNGRTFGSWVEYGILAPGPIEQTASLSGYAGSTGGGYDGLISTNSCDPNINRLTFANTVAVPGHETECGYFSEGSGLIPDVVTTLTSETLAGPSPYTTSPALKLDANSPTGLYKNDLPNANFEIGESTLTPGRNKTYVVYVPNGTVTITGNIQYAGDTYSDIRDIPQLVIIAKNININVNVTNVDAWLVAKSSDDTGGIVDTCVGYTAPFSADACKDTLTINGPIMARELDLWRTKVDMSNPSCKVTASQDCHSVGEPAEILNLPASAILWAKAYRLNPAKAQTSYTIELPPYF